MSRRAHLRWLCAPFKGLAVMCMCVDVQMSKLAMDLRAKNMGLYQMRNSTAVVNGIFLMLAGYWICSRHPVGEPIAMLPFYTPNILQKITHNGLGGPMNECSVVRASCACGSTSGCDLHLPWLYYFQNLACATVVSVSFLAFASWR